MSDLALHYDSRPRGVPLVLLPAFPFDGRMWNPALREAGIDAIRVDPPGFGDSPQGNVIAARYGAPVAASLELYADALAGSLDQMGVERIVLAGASMGGYAAMAFAARHPQRLAALGLFGTKSVTDTAEQIEVRLRQAESAEGQGTDVMGGQLVVLLERLLAPGTHVTNERLYHKLESWLEQAPSAGIAWAQRAMAARSDRTRVLRSLEIPAVVARGELDVICTREDHEIMADALGVPFHEIPDAGHLVAVEAPQATAGFLTRLMESAR